MYDQVVSEGKDIVPTNELSIVPRQRKKWLNIVLEMNGVLGQCILKFELGRVRRVHEMRDNIFSHETPTIVGGKAVYARQNLREFLRQLSNIALRIVVWMSMVRSNADLVASYLFRGNPKPYRILAQDQCKMIAEMGSDVLVRVADYKKPNCYFLEDPFCSQQRAEGHDISVLVILC